MCVEMGDEIEYLDSVKICVESSDITSGSHFMSEVWSSPFVPAVRLLT